MINENIIEISRLNKLIEALVTISNIHEKDGSVENNIEDEINYILDEYKSIINEKNIQIKYIQKQDFIIKADREYLYILLSNIIKNAIKFSNKSCTINVSYMDNSCVIQDFGCGIEKENISNIFRRFFQEKDARN
jgi:signal transduction histidine kinase